MALASVVIFKVAALLSLAVVFAWPVSCTYQSALAFKGTI